MMEITRKASRSWLFFVAGLLMLLPGRPAYCSWPFLDAPLVPEREVRMGSGPVPAWSRTWAQARELVRQGRFADAAVRYREVLALRESDGARWELARVLYRLGRYAEMEELCGELAGRHPENWEFQACEGVAAQARGRDARALAILTGISDDPAVPEAALLASLEESYRKLGEKEKAYAALARYTTLVPAATAAKRRLLLLAEDLGRTAELEGVLAELLEGDDPEILAVAARAQGRTGDGDQAARLWRRYLAVAADPLPAHLYLADYCRARGEDGEALVHWRYVEQHARKPVPGLDREMGLLLERNGQPRAAEPYLDRALAAAGSDVELLQALIRVLSETGDEERALALLERYLALESRPEAGYVRQAAELHRQRGELRQAVDLYRQLVVRYPDEPAILREFGAGLRALGEERQAVEVFRRLARLTPDDLESWQDLARLLNHPEQRNEFLGVLEKMVELAPADAEILAELVRNHIEDGNRARLMELYPRLVAIAAPSPAVRAERARAAFLLGLYGQAAADGEAVIMDDSLPASMRQPLQEVAVHAAAGMGDVAAVVRLTAAAGWSPEEKAGALLVAGDADAALRLLEPVPAADLAGMLLRADLYREVGRYADAEQILRAALLRTGNADGAVILRLAEVALAEGSPEQGLAWLELADGLTGTITDARFGVVPVVVHLPYLRGLLLQAEGNRRAAVRQAEQALRLAGGNISAPYRLAVNLLLLQAGGGQGQGAAAGVSTPGEQMIAGIEGIAQARQRGDAAAEARLLSNLRTEARKDEGLRQIFARSAYTAGLDDLVLTALDLSASPRGGRLLLCRAALRAGEDALAEQSLRRLLEDDGGAGYPRYLLADLLYRQGRFDEAAAEVDRLLAGAPGRAELLLLQARVRWAQRRYEEALAAYRLFLVPDVTEEFVVARGEGRRSRPSERWLRAWIGLEESEPLVEALDRQRRGETGPDIALAVPFTTRSRWQRRFAAEYAARLAVQRQEYQHAAKLYLPLIAREPREKSLLFDLAGIYCRLERFGEESGINGRLLAMDPFYPGLAEADRRNRLQRRPSVALAQRWEERAGRDDSVGIAILASTLSMWYAPGLDNELEFSADRLRYRSLLEEDGHESANRWLLAYGANPLPGWSVRLGAGREGLDSGAAATTLLQASAGAEFRDRLEGYVAYRRDVVLDTLQGLRAAVNVDEAKAGFGIDLLPRLQAAGDYLYRDYSDGIESEGYGARLRATLHQEPYLLQAGFGYEYVDSTGVAPAGALAGGGAGRPYWAPQNYWLNNFSLYYKHLLSRERFGRDTPGYFDIAGTFGHDADGYAVQGVAASVFAETGDHFLWRAGAGITNAQSYRERKLSMEIRYRW